MRTIKFRAIPHDYNEFIYGGYVRNQGTSYIYTTMYEKTTHINILTSISVHKDTVGQFTGLKDKNGKEIYEGDIVCGDIFDEKFKMAEVVFDVGCFSVSVKEDWCPALYDVTADTTVIIGNIHEDPELLEAK